ncbi:hypothetical protein LOD99_15088 [Oopsacas minuta]|uniref:Transposase n=1 Tax=Oopsacas minuta TaxID=111878 RepID=A0AAV7KD09_9METZ|nr:hypothetical protein LOD99_15088 [Oopsacas minuta]
MLKHADELRRKEMTTVLMGKIESTKSFLSHLWTTDEAHFHLDGQVNSKSNIFWVSSRPDEVNETPLHSQKVTVWCALPMKGIIGPLFFEESRQTVTVTKERYVDVLNKFWDELETRYHTHIPKSLFQQDGATPHTANITINWLKELFKHRVVSKRCEIGWPPYSPDLSPQIFSMGLFKR